MYEAAIEANVPDADIAQFLAEDQGWLEAQWPECVRLAEAAEHTVTGDPVLSSYTLSGASDDGFFYIYKFHVPTDKSRR